VLPARMIREIEKKWSVVSGQWSVVGQGEDTTDNGPRTTDHRRAIEHAIGMEIAWSRQELTATLKAENRRRCGFKRGEDELIKHEDGTYNEAAILRETYFECYHCGSAWRDDGEFGRTRIALDESSHYVAANPQALGCNVGFNVPQWINRRLSWGKIMLEKLKAQKLAAEFGNYGPLMRWWQKTAARTWDEDELRRNREVALNVGSYETDPEKLMPDFHSRDMGVDCQKKLGPDGLPVDEDVVGSFWWIIREFDKHGNSRQLARGFAESWEEWIAEQKRWKVPNTRVAIDSAKWTPSIMMKAAMEFEMVTPAVPHPLTQRKDPYASCWRLFFGDKRGEFKVQGQLRNVSEGNATAPFFVQDKAGRRFPVRLFKYRWSNLAFEKQLDAIMERTPGMPKWETLPRETLPAKVQQKETGILTFEQQLSARYKTTVRGADKYEDIAGREAHYRDCELMLLARASQDGLLGHVQIEDESGKRKAETGN